MFLKRNERHHKIRNSYRTQFLILSKFLICLIMTFKQIFENEIIYYYYFFFLISVSFKINFLFISSHYLLFNSVNVELNCPPFSLLLPSSFFLILSSSLSTSSSSSHIADDRLVLKNIKNKSRLRSKRCYNHSINTTQF